MFSDFYPREDWESAYTVDYERFYKNGIRGIIFDIDNTLVEHGAPATEQAVALIDRLRRRGYAICILSNNEKARVSSFCAAMDIPYLYKAGKPKRKGYTSALQLLGTTKEQTISVGDQIFTDIWGANRAGIYTVLVGRVGKKEEIQIVLKRQLEKIILHFYRKNKKKEQ